MSAPEKYKGQYNDKHKEIVLEYKVILNFVMPGKTDESKVDKWFQDMVSALLTGVQIQHGIMNSITVEKIDNITESIMYNEPKANSSYQKDVNRLTKLCTRYKEANDARKKQIDLWNKFFRKLLAEGRITKEELKPYCPKLKDVRKAKINHFKI